MIESISLSSVASFTGPPETLSELKKINFVYGANGSGKTTISRVIANPEEYPSCPVQWSKGNALQTMVYNRDFVERNFTQSDKLKGVFTLGENQAETLERIKDAREKLDELGKQGEKLTLTLGGPDGRGGKKGELESIEDSFKQKCWAQKQRHDAKLQGAFEGFRNSRDKFKIKVLEELKINQSELIPLADLEMRCGSVFETSSVHERSIPSIDAVKLLEYEKHPILKKPVIGKDDVDISGMIKKLGNSDWVRQGRRYFEDNEGICPFCQQNTDEDFATSLEDYFDETFLADSQKIDGLYNNYKSMAELLQEQIDNIISSSSRFLGLEDLKTKKQVLDSMIAVNIQRLSQKKKETSQIIELDSLSGIVMEIKVLIDSANKKVQKHNSVVANLAQEKKTLTSQVWKFILEEMDLDIREYLKKTGDIQKAIRELEKQIAGNKAEKAKKESEIRELAKQVTSVRPTIDEMNKLLASFGFSGFHLKMAQNDNSYILVRQDGSEAKSSLSEGERTFVTFLYFYHLLEGSFSESGTTKDSVVVIDDPVSSLDSDVLFIVSSLIKKLFKKAISGSEHIKQIFVLTHNVYFHKEVSFNPRRTRKALNHESFWIVCKDGLTSMVEQHDKNPIKTSYELLWSEVRRKDRSIHTIQNTLRRILENYFKILGRTDTDELCAKFDGREQLICKSLFSWLHDGSHFAQDDLYIAIDKETVDKYLKVFREIFEKSGHLAHYEMMMDVACVK